MKLKLMNLFLIGSIVILVMVGGCKKEEVTPPSSTPDTGVFTDNRDGKDYKWVKIGDLVWMAENLAYKPTPANDYVAYNNDENNVSIYGYLYTQETAKTIAPDGWRLPTKDDFRALVNEFGGDEQAYIKLLESGTTHWLSPNLATNESGFTVLPAGYYNPSSNEFRGIGEWTAFVSSSLYPGGTGVMVLRLNRNFEEASVEGNPSIFYYSVRCIKN